MKKNIGLVVFGIITIVIFLGFMSVQTKKKSSEEKQQGSGVIFPDMMNQLSRNMSLWSRLSRDEKKQAVSAVIAIYKSRDNIAILNTSDFYATRIDETLASDPAVMNIDILTMLRILSIMEYDYYNGKNKDTLARETLGEKAFTENQTRRQNAAQNR